MSNGRTPNLMDINWAQVNANQRATNLQKFRNDFLLDVKNRMLAYQPKLNWDGSTLSFEPAKDKDGKRINPLTETELWNMYVNSAQSTQQMGVSVDMNFYETQVKPYWRAYASQTLSKQLDNLAGRVDAETLKKLYKTNSEFADALDYTINNEENADKQAAYRELRPAAGEDSTIGPWTALGLTGGSLYGLRQLSKWQPEGKWSKGLKKGLPLGALMFSDPLLGMFGASDEQKEMFNRGLDVAFPGYYGYQFLQENISGRRKDLMMSAVAQDTQKDLIKKAKALNIDTDKIKAKGGNYYQNLQKEVSDKIGSQKVGTTSKQFKAGNIAAPKFTKKPKFKVRGKGNLAAMAASLLLPKVIDEIYGQEPMVQPGDVSSVESLGQDVKSNAYENYNPNKRIR